MEDFATIVSLCNKTVSQAADIYFFNVNTRSTKKVWNMFRVNNKNTRTNLLLSLDGTQAEVDETR